MGSATFVSIGATGLIENIKNPTLSLADQRRQLDLVRRLNERHLQARQSDLQLEARLQSFELAYRMQSEAADSFDAEREPAAVREAYGAGPIGREMARLAPAIGMNVLAWTFHPSAERAAALDLQFVPLDEVLARADVVSLHVKLSDQTRGLIGARQIGLMKPGALLVNTARGAVVDTPALVAALNSGQLAGAADHTEIFRYAEMLAEEDA